MACVKLKSKCRQNAYKWILVVLYMDTWWCPLIEKWQRYYFRYQVFIHGSIRSFCLQLTNNVYIFYSRFVCHIMLYIKGRWCNEIYQIIFEIKRIPIIWYFSRVNQIRHFGWDVGKIYRLLATSFEWHQLNLHGNCTVAGASNSRQVFKLLHKNLFVLDCGRS